jgi:hypothetical protein
MIREDRFLVSRRPYAINLSSLQIDLHRCTVNAVWFRRRSGKTMACVGHLWDYQNPTPKDTAEFLTRHDDGRFGGTCEGRWDGERYWGSQWPGDIAEHLKLLKPMLANYPAVPVGYDGWWRF